MDKVDKKIVKLLKENKVMNKGELMLKTFARETNTTFTNRLRRLESEGIISIDIGGSNGKIYSIKLIKTERFK